MNEQKETKSNDKQNCETLTRCFNSKIEGATAMTVRTRPDRLELDKIRDDGVTLATLVEYSYRHAVGDRDMDLERLIEGSRLARLIAASVSSRGSQALGTH